MHLYEDTPTPTFYAEPSFLCTMNVGLHLLATTDGLSDGQVLSRKTSYYLLVRRSVQRDLIGEIDLTKKEAHSIWSWAPGSKGISDDEASFTLLMIRRILWVGKRLCSASLEKIFAAMRQWRPWITPSFTVHSNSCCASLLKILWFVCFAESFSTLRPVLFVGMWHHR